MLTASAGRRMSARGGQSGAWIGTSTNGRFGRVRPSRRALSVSVSASHRLGHNRRRLCHLESPTVDAQQCMLSNGSSGPPSNTVPATAAVSLDWQLVASRIARLGDGVLLQLPDGENALSQFYGDGSGGGSGG
eukprot:ctg_6118.g589